MPSPLPHDGGCESEIEYLCFSFAQSLMPGNMSRAQATWNQERQHSIDGRNSRGYDGVS
jgi:hypothetical protein